MSFTLDIIIVLIIGLTIYFAAKNGFVKTAISAFSFIIAVILTATFAQPVAEIVRQTPITETIQNATEERITDILLDNSLEPKALVEGESSDFNSILAITGIDKEDLKEWYRDNVFDSDEARQQLAKKIAEPIVDTVTLIIAVVVVYIAAQVLLAAISFVLDKIFRLPVLKSFNKGLGIAVGVVLALFRVCLFCFAVNILLENSQFLGNDFIESLVPEKTMLFKFFSEIDIYSFFI